MEDRKLSNTMKVHRARFGWTQSQLAERVGVSRKTITTVETGRFVPSTWLALVLAKELETTVEALFQLEQEVAQAADASLPWYLHRPEGHSA